MRVRKWSGWDDRRKVSHGQAVEWLWRATVDW